MSGVMRFVLADVEPFAQIVGAAPRPVFVNRQEPPVVTFAEFGERFFAALIQEVQMKQKRANAVGLVVGQKIGRGPSTFASLSAACAPGVNRSPEAAAA